MIRCIAIINVVLQSHLKKLFAGIYAVLFDDSNSHITAMKSLEGEVVNLDNSVKITPRVEVGTNYRYCIEIDTILSLEWKNIDIKTKLKCVFKQYVLMYRYLLSVGLKVSTVVLNHIDGKVKRIDLGNDTF